MSLTPRLTEVSVLKKLLGEVATSPQRSAGQNFLICEEVIEATVSALDKNISNVTELGAGLGVLTQALLGRGWQVRAIERDSHLTPLLPKCVQPSLRKNLEVVEGDLREHDWTWPEAYHLVGNIPYNLSGLIIRRLTSTEPAPTRVVLLVQKEVGERLIATPECPSLITLAVRLWGQADKLANVPRSCFWPQPNVDSMLVFLEANQSGLTLAEREKILAFAKPAYQHQRKQLQGSLRNAYNLPPQKIEQALGALGLAPTVRPAELGKEHWQHLTQSLT